MTMRPRSATTIKVKEIQTKAMAAGPTWQTRYSCVVDEMVAAADAAATCCHKADASRNSDPMARANIHTCVTGLDGKGLISMSEPVLGSVSLCQPGSVERPMKASAVRAIPPILNLVSNRSARTKVTKIRCPHTKPGKTTSFLTRAAIPMAFSGSFFRPPRMVPSPRPLPLPHTQSPARLVSAQRPKYPHRTVTLPPVAA